MGEVDLAGEFATCRSAWRLAALDVYVVPEEAAAIDTWERTGTAVSVDDGWLPIVAAARRRGTTVGRVQVFSRPLTRYAQWLLAVYPLNVAAGEDVRIAYRDVHPDGLAELRGDFWIFDDARVARMSYDHRGRFIVAWDETAYLDDYRQIRDRALAVAQPIGQIVVA